MIHSKNQPLGQRGLLANLNNNSLFIPALAISSGELNQEKLLLVTDLIRNPDTFFKAIYFTMDSVSIFFDKGIKRNFGSL